MPLQATSGAASYDAFGGGVAVVPTYIEDVFSTFLTLGAGTTATITNGIDLSGKGGLVWLKDRTGGGYHSLADTARSGNRLFSNTTDAQTTSYPFAFTSTGFTLDGNLLDSGRNFVSWTWRKQPKFFDIQTWTGTGSARTIAHNLGSVPGCIIVKNLTTAGDWRVYHRGLTSAEYDIRLNLTNSQASVPSAWNSTAPTSTVFSLGANGDTNGSGDSFVAYLFAHNAGGFGLTGTDNVISCGSVVGSSQVEVNLGYEPQWILVKNASAAQDWWVVDNMRGLPVQDTGGAYNASNLRPNLSDAETTGFSIAPSATGFKANVLTSGQTYIYIAIRRGPMKVPTTGTSVFSGVSRTGTDANATISSIGFPPDTLITKNRSGTASPIGAGWLDRLRGLNNFLITDSGSAENTAQTDILRSWNMNGATLGPDANTSRFNWSANTYMNWFFRRAPSFMDICAYSGTGSAMTVSHNLTTVPELIFVKRRNASGSWQVYSSALANTEYLVLDSTDAKATGATRWNSTTPTSSVFSLGTDATVNASGGTYIVYLFASAPTVSKVGSYTGTGTTKQIDCGFTAGARFVVIKRTDSTGDWYVWDSIRGIVSGNDPYILLNSGDAEVTSTDYIDTYSAGFEISSTAPAAINASGGSFIFLAIS